jgi:hypothetical protein
MASWAYANHPGVVAMSLRNELRQLLLQDTNNGDDWYDLVSEAGTLVHQANPNVLVVVGSISSATALSSVRTNRMLNTTGWPGKHVWEWHSYSFTTTFPHILPCSILIGRQHIPGVLGRVRGEQRQRLGGVGAAGKLLHTQRAEGLRRNVGPAQLRVVGATEPAVPRSSRRHVEHDAGSLDDELVVET